jgi:hypothetical protein
MAIIVRHFLLTLFLVSRGKNSFVFDLFRKEIDCTLSLSSTYSTTEYMLYAYISSLRYGTCTVRISVMNRCLNRGTGI